jgi:hypothetical protein
MEQLGTLFPIHPKIQIDGSTTQDFFTGITYKFAETIVNFDMTAITLPSDCEGTRTGTKGFGKLFF